MGGVFVLKYISKRIFYAIITIWVIATITFLLMKALPGDPFQNPKLQPEMRAALNQKYGLDQPVLKQYGVYIKNVAKGDLGMSYKYKGRSVSNIIAEAFPKSFALGWRAMLFATVFGLLLGVVAALKHEKPLDYLVIFIAIIGVSVPSIVMGPLLAYIFGVNLQILPVTVKEGNELSMLLPSITLGLGTLAFVARLMRTTTLEVLGNDIL
jgi:oligopeptide transport system permease protein